MSVDRLAPGFEAQTSYKFSGTCGISNIMKKRLIDGRPFEAAILLMPMTDALATGTPVENNLSSFGDVIPCPLPQFENCGPFRYRCIVPTGLLLL
jgi:hypothetical protein